MDQRLIRAVGVWVYVAAVACGAPTPSQPRASQPEERRYSFVVGGEPVRAGTLLSNGDAVATRFTLEDGTEVEVAVTLDGHGVPVRYVAKGRKIDSADANAGSAAGLVVDELFRVEAGVATWRNPADAGSMAWTKPAFYVPFAGDPFGTGLLAEALLLAPAHRLGLFPTGEASLEKLGSLTVEGPAGKREITQYMLWGVMLMKVVWLDADGKLFAELATDSGDGLVLAGYEGSLEALKVAQAEALEKRWERLAAELTHRPARGLLIRGARLFDPVSLSLSPNTSVLVLGSQIEAVGPDGSLTAPEGVEVLDADGRFLMPGLWDNHTHLTSEITPMLLAAGVTSVREMSGNEEQLRRVERIDAGEELGPRVLTVMRIDGSKESALRFAPYTPVVATEAEAVKLVEESFARGYKQVKVLNGMSPEMIPILARETHRRGMRLSGHVPFKMSAQQFLEAGADEIQHILFVITGFFFGAPRPEGDLGSMLDQWAAQLEIEQGRVQDFIELMKARGAALDPTVVAFEEMFDGKGSSLSPTYEKVPFALPPTAGHFMFQNRQRTAQPRPALIRKMLALVKALHDAGVTVLPGTDTFLDVFAGFKLQRELELYEQAGIAPAEVLRMATYDSARNAGLEKRRGSIAPGQDADMILIDGDPTRNISDIRRVRTVIKGGWTYDPSAIYQALGLRPAAKA